MGKFVDFDAAKKEREKKPVSVRAFSKDWKLYDSPPIKGNLEFIKRRKENDGKLTIADEIDILEMIVPPSIFKAWLDQNMTMADADDLLARVIAAYNGEADGQGEAKAPKKGAKKSR